MRVFLSSTCYDLADLRAVIERTIRDLGHEPVLSDRLEFPVDTSLHRHDVCLEEAAKADLLVVVIDRRFGAEYFRDSAISITWAEYRAAAAAGVNACVFIRRGIFNERQTWLKNDKDLKPAFCDDPRTFDFIGEIQRDPRGLWMDVAFDDVTQVEDRIRIVERIRTRRSSDIGVEGASKEDVVQALAEDADALKEQRTELSNRQSQCQQDAIDHGWKTGVRHQMQSNVHGLGARIGSITKEIQSLERSREEYSALSSDKQIPLARHGESCPFCSGKLVERNRSLRFAVGVAG